MNIIKPTLLLDKRIFARNIEAMIRKCEISQVPLRPHCKTIQSTTLAQYFKERGVNQIAVSSLQMASYFANDGWEDITVAIPTNILEIDKINNLSKVVKLHITIESSEVLDKIEALSTSPISVFIKIDIGTKRTGIPIEDYAQINQLKNRIHSHKNTTFKGFIIHAGHTYSARSKEEILTIHQENTKLVQMLKSNIHGDYIISIGDTPTCSVADNFGLADEVRAGNFVFYDVMQKYIGSCDLDNIAVCLACPIIAKHADRNEIIIHGGGIHLSKDSTSVGSKKIFGHLARIGKDKWDILPTENYVSKLSQEHGTLQVTDEVFDQFNVGDIIGILPVHSCMCANLMKRYFTLDGEEIRMMSTF